MLLKLNILRLHTLWIFSPENIELGKLLFFDPVLLGNGQRVRIMSKVGTCPHGWPPRRKHCVWF
jgi:hypothetical protein